MGLRNVSAEFKRVRLHFIYKLMQGNLSLVLNKGGYVFFFYLIEKIISY
jgi:hypothetical protein